MEMEKKILRNVLKPKNQGDFANLVAYKVLSHLNLEEFINEIENIFIEAVDFFNDNAALVALKIFACIRDQGLITPTTFVERIQEFYRKMPYGKEECFTHKFSPILVESKKFILEEIIKEWNVVNHNQVFKAGAKKLFKIFMSCYSPMPRNIRKINELESDYDFKIRGRAVFESDKKIIEDVFRGALKNVLPEDLLVWMREPNIPDELAKIMGIAWARNGGYLELMKK